MATKIKIEAVPDVLYERMGSLTSDLGQRTIIFNIKIRWRRYS